MLFLHGEDIIDPNIHVFSPFLDLIPIALGCLFDPVITVFIISGVFQNIRQILLPNPMVRIAVGIKIALLPFLV